MTTAIETTMVTTGDPLWQMEADMEASGSQEPRVQKNESRLFHYIKLSSG